MRISLKPSITAGWLLLPVGRQEQRPSSTIPSVHVQHTALQGTSGLREGRHWANKELGKRRGRPARHHTLLILSQCLASLCPALLDG